MGVLNGQQQHRYQTCRDEDCERFPCRVYTEGRERGYREGYDRGWDKGYAQGYAEGYAAGFAAGVASASR